jgi:GT2 family glycosyltransferase
MIITGSIVTYNNKKIVLKKAVHNFLDANQNTFLYIIDNSSTDQIKDYFLGTDRIVYIHNPSNPGFGAAHNLAIKKALIQGSKFHFIINPDIYFEEDVVSEMVTYMKSDVSIGMMMPQILNFDGSIQNLPKLLPSPLSIFLRKIKRPRVYYSKFIEKYELRNLPKKQIINVPILSGCFTLLNFNAIKQIGMYDDNYFMYFEDWDLSRRMHKKYKTIYYPLVSVYHGYESGANKSFNLFIIFIQSAFTYFNKWGWFIDNERTKMNKRALSQFD